MVTGRLTMAMKVDRIRLLALGGVAGPLVFATTVAVTSILRANYSHTSAFISELGATSTTDAGLMNYAGFLPTGSLLIAFALALANLVPRDRIAMLGVFLVGFAGAGVFSSGVFSCDVGCPQGRGTLENQIHNAIGPITFIALSLGATVLGLRFRRSPRWHSLWIYSILSGVAGLALLVVMAGSIEARQLTGLWQRLLLAVLFSWCAVVGVWGFQQPSNRANSE